MRCPFCKQNDDKVIDSRESTDAVMIRRRRECVGCGRRFTTRERIDEMDMPLRVVKRDNTRQSFERRKILSGMISAVRSARFPCRISRTSRSASRRSCSTARSAEVSSRSIGLLVMKELKKLDKVAYVRFASVYKNFESPEDSPRSPAR